MRMKIKQLREICDDVQNIDIHFYKTKICQNLKRIRLHYYEKYKEEHNGASGFYNPYSSENISSYLNMSKVHYKRLENENDKCKHISIDNLIKLTIIYGIDINEFLK